jgi:hypothetical protein
MDAEKVAVATITWVRSADEEALLVRSLGLLASCGLPVAVADRGTSPPFTSALRRFPQFTVTVPPEAGLVPQVKASLELAATFGRPFTLYVEPDKEFFFGHRMSEFVRCAPDASDVGVVLASRSEESFRTFPPMQQYTEGVINHLCREMIGSEGDYAYGPFLLNGALLPAITSAAAHRLGWGWRPFAFLTAHRRAFPVLHLTADYPCPPDQRGEGNIERAHRLRQLSENVLGLIDGAL